MKMNLNASKIMQCSLLFFMVLVVINPLAFAFNTKLSVAASRPPTGWLPPQVHPHIQNSASYASSSTAILHAKSKKKDTDSDDKATAGMWKTMQEKPASLIFLPIVALFGLDLVLNIFFITKRSIEYFVLGQTPSQETWF
jgi:hypothetical protein